MKTISVIGPTTTRWGQTVVHDNLYAVLELPHTENVAETGHQIIESLTQRYDETPPTTASALAQLLSPLALPEDASLTVAAIANDTIHLAGQGNGKAFLYRGSTWAPIFEKNQPISGPLQKHDRVFLCTPSLLRAISENQLAQFAQPEELNDIEEDIAAQLHQSDQSDGAACFILENTTLPEKPIPSSPTAPSPRTLEKKRPNRRKVTLTVGSVLAILLITSLFFGSRERARVAREAQLQQVLGAVTSAIEEGEALVDVNPTEAREKLIPAHETLTEALDTFPEESSEYQEVVQLVNKTSELLEQSERKYELQEPNLFMDLTWITDDAEGNRIHRSDDTLSVLDTKNGALYSTTLEKKNNTVEASRSEFKKSIDIVRKDNNPYILTQTNDGYAVIDKDAQPIVEGFDGNPIALETFAGNLYVLDTQKGILVMPSTEEGFGSPRSWFSEDVSLDLGDAQDFAIDGSIWTVTNDNILKFTQGVPDAYTMKDGVLTSAKALYTDSDSNLLYILEDERVVVFDKKGAYQEQYLWEGLRDATDIFAIDDQQILILHTKTIYQIDR